ncbi:non-ribosomal peptide synthetase [Echria macrotheca]|uniref:Non-ribosomal peptide synthetase n=1 Tax=Echria macrotheca TaxID=438768 RepID=A0AAJ0FFE3_9PEZI|nr:non-ribosomal peptide synthetase [Echria macrotheca]
MAFPGNCTKIGDTDPGCPGSGTPDMATCRFPRFTRPGANNGSEPAPSWTRIPIVASEPEKLAGLAGTGTEPGALGAVLRGAWAVLLRCYTGQDDVSFGFVRCGDNPCSTLVRFGFDKPTDVSDLVADAKTEQTALGDSNPGADTAVILLDFSTPKIEKPNYVNLVLLVTFGDDAVDLVLEWDQDVIGMSPAQGALVADAFDAILSGVLLASPDVSVDTLGLIGSSSLAQLKTWNDSVPTTTLERCIHHVIAEKAIIQPQAEAICAWDGSMTFQKLEAASSSLAARLIELGVGPEVLVPLCFEKSKFNIVAMLAVLKAGGAFVPLDPTHPADRLRHICQSIGAPLILCSRNHMNTVSGITDNVLPVDQATLNAANAAPFEGVASPENAAYVIFTSGSTGNPKGTVIQHRAFCSSASAHAPALRIDGDCRVLQFAAHTFDASLVEILTPLMVGGCVCIPSEQERLEDLATAINRMAVNHAVLTPSFVGFLSPSDVPGLRRLVLAGEAMSTSHVATWSHLELVNGYGPAESSVAAVCNSSVGPNTEPTDIGVPCGVRVWLVDVNNHHRLVPVGCVGEMLLEGPSLARGYLNDPAKTEDAFIFDPAWALGADSPRRFYKTGDLARYNSSAGSLTYVGRKDTQIKFHGQRIELGEIEHHLAVDENIQHALVLLPKAGPLKGRIVAVFSLPESTEGNHSTSEVLSLSDKVELATSTETTARTRLGARLPTYMVPSVWLCVGAVPLLASRKMNRKAVTTWVETTITAEECRQAIMHSQTTRTALSSEENHLTPAEMRLHEVWSVVLNLPSEKIDVNEHSFLGLGGDSITAMTCASRANKAHVHVKVQDVLRAKSIRQLAKVARVVDDAATRSSAETCELGKPFDLSPIQQLHFQTRGRAEGDEHFNQSFHLRLTRHVKTEHFQAAVEQLVMRHAMLRARFDPGEQSPGCQWRQVITDEVTSSYRFRVHAVASENEADTAIADAQGCLNVVDGPIFAAEFFEIPASQQMVFMTAHHLVIDLVSWRILLDEMEEILETQASCLEFPSTLSFQKWTMIQSDDCGGRKLDSLLHVKVPESSFSYWEMANGRPNLYGDVACEGFEIDSATTALLLSTCHAPFGTEAVDLLLAALAWSFGTTFTDRPLPTVFNEGHGREPPSSEIDLSRTVGWFTTLFPIALTSPKSFVDALVQTKDLRRQASGNGRRYFAACFHHPDASREWAGHGSMEIAFNFLGRYQQLERTDALFQAAAAMAGEAHTGHLTADFGHKAQRFALFEISAVVVQGSLRFSFAWNKNMRHQERIHNWLPACRETLVDAASFLPTLDRKVTRSDFPLLRGLTMDDLNTFETTLLPKLVGDQGWSAVEDMYPASPIQQGLLVSQSKDTSVYAVRKAFQIRCQGGFTDSKMTELADAWRRVVRHHALLRTVFVDNIAKNASSGFDQVVLSDVEPKILIHTQDEGLDDEDGLNRLLQTIRPMEYKSFKTHHRFSIFRGQKNAFGVLEINHAVMDGQSMDILVRDLGRSYSGHLEQMPRPLFSPFIASLQQRDKESDIAFWSNYLDGMEPCHFPVLNDGVHVSAEERRLQSLRVTVSNLNRLRNFCGKMAITLPNAFTAAWALVLSCYTGTDDVCFGYLASGRDATLIEGSGDAVGPFINMATQRVKTGNGDKPLSLIEIVESVQRDQLACMPYAQTSLAEIQHALRIPGGMALFNTCISYRRQIPTAKTTSGAMVFEDLEAIHDPTEYPVSLNIETSDDDEAFIDLDFWTDALSVTQAQHIAAFFTHALFNLTEKPTVPISDLDHVPNSTKEVIWSWNANTPPTTSDCMHRMVEQQVNIRPDEQAVCGWDAKFSYKEMDCLADRLSHHLTALGVGPEILVPVCFDKSAWTVIAMLAVLKAGGAVVPLDANHPVQALQGKVFDSGAHIVVASETRAALFNTMVTHVVPVGQSLLTQLPHVDGKAEKNVTPHNPAFIMFTSGSTGKPKGVVLCHEALTTSCLAHGAALGVGPHTRFLQFAAHTFDNSIEEMFTTLIHGGCVCVPSEDDRLSDLPGAISTLGANFMDLTPTVAAMIQPIQVPTIREICVGGEALTQAVLDAWGGVIPVHNQYGPSECSINSTHRLHTQATGDISNIGTSVGSQSWVVSPHNHNKLAPVGCVGELLIEGPILARGYLNNPEATARSFIEAPAWSTEDPHHSQRGRRRMYKTGDLVRYNSDGSLIYLGRKDTQVKLHGQRIELGEIEHHVKASVRPNEQSAVELVSLKGSLKSLVVFLASPADDLERESELGILPMTAAVQTTAQNIVARLAANVASYMVPGVLFPVSRMPLTSSGKLDRRSLRTMAEALPAEALKEYRLGNRSSDGRKPETPAEKELQELWSLVLRVDSDTISADDSFFRHGGDSIGAMRLVAAARQRGIILSVAKVFQLPKLSDMANAVAMSPTSGDSGNAAQLMSKEYPEAVEPFSLLRENSPDRLDTLKRQAASLCRLQMDTIEDIYPCAPLQAGLLAASQRQPGAYVAANLYSLPANTDITRFKKAWQDVARSEAILRTRVVFVDGVGFLQVVTRDEIRWDSVADMSAVPKTWYQLPRHDGDVLSRYVIIGEHTQQPRFLWIAHHALYDGWSLSTLLDRVETRYRSSELSFGPVPHYTRFIQYLEGLDQKASDAFWVEKLSDSDSAPRHFPQLPSPAYQVKTTAQTHRSVALSRSKNTELTTASFIRASWALTLSFYSSSDDVAFCEVLHGRDVPVAGIEDLVGPTFTSVPRRTRISRSLSVAETLGSLQEQFNDVIPHQFSGLQRIKSLTPSAAAACEFQNLLAINTDDDFPPDSLWNNLVSGGNTQSADFFNYPLNVTCTIRPTDDRDLIEVHAHFDENVIPSWLAGRILGQFEAVITQLSAAETQHTNIGDIQILSHEDKASIRQWNSVAKPEVHKLIHHMISERMIATGLEATAVIGWDVTLSNGELESLSSAFARSLVSQGVGRNGGSKLVPFCFEKSTTTIVAMLGILKAGAAFVPLDPAHPVSRLKEIVVDCGARVVVCSPKLAEMCQGLAPTVVPGDLDLIKTLRDEAKDPARDLNDAAPCTPNDVAYLIFTSGTTGKPKGTVISHSAFCSGAAVHGPAMGMIPPFRFLQFASYTFDASLVEILTTLMMGGTICVPRDEDRTNGNLAAFMEESGVTMTLLTPSFARTLQPTDVPSLETLILGGEAMSRSHLERWADKLTLVNAYGPSECAVVASVKSKMNSEADPANLGKSIGRAWIVDPRNHDRLAPVGSVGELLVEGPILSSGYLRNDAKTRDVFIEGPRWATLSGFRYTDMEAGNHRRRFYKTGDLVRFADGESGEMLYVGRKDSSQAKINGQRLELDEISHHLDADNSVRHSVVIVPKTGPCAGRLTSVIVPSRAFDETLHIPGAKFELVVTDKTFSLAEDIQERLREKVPAYMVPSMWILLSHIPLLPSGKLDRLSVAKFLESTLTEDILAKITGQLSPSSRNATGQVQTPSIPSVDEQLRAIWSEVLNVPVSRVGDSVSFLHLGGDSISAMQVMAKCRTLGIQVNVHDIIHCKSIHHLAVKLGVQKPHRPAAVANEDHHDFDPSPIQQLYFDVAHNGDSRTERQFNQSILLRLRKGVDPQQFARGIQALVETHSMLRARFRRNGTGVWRQRITADVTGSYRYNVSTLRTASRMQKRIQASQRSLDIQNGPLLAAECFVIGSQMDVYAFVAIHHLVVDVVSWGILLQDLEDFFTTGTIKTPVSMPFQAWNRAQAQRAEQEKCGTRLLPHREAPILDLEYWGMVGKANVQGDAIVSTVDLDSSTTSLLLDQKLHGPLETEPLDILLAALLLSYQTLSPGRRGVPTVFNEGHGREPWDSDLDLSRTVGWFTTLCPVHLPQESSQENEIAKAVFWVRDYRRRLSGSGRPYFAYQVLTPQGREDFGQPGTVEILFNYLGQIQNLLRENSSLQLVHDVAYSASDIGKGVPRFALIEVSAQVSDSMMRISISYNKHMSHQDSLGKLASEYQRVLQEACERLRLPPQRSMTGRFDLLPLTYYGADNLDRCLRDINVLIDDVQDVYPCSPMQRGILLSQLRDPEKYAYHAVFQLDCNLGAVDIGRLRDAWQKVVDRHSALRTVFIDTLGDEGLMDQVVLRRAQARMDLLRSDSYDGALECLSKLDHISYNEKTPPHRLSICKSSSGHIFCRLDISHAICDGSSMPILLEDLSKAYGGTLHHETAPAYRDYISHIQSQPRTESVKYWKEYLSDAEPCLFPALNDGDSEAEKSLGSHIITIANVASVMAYCANSSITLSTFFQLVWGLVLRTYTGSDQVLFGYLASGRDIPLPNIDRAVGAFINMLVCRLDLPVDAELGDVMDTLAGDLSAAMLHQTCSLAEIQHEIHLVTSSLFNTAFTYQKRASRLKGRPSAAIPTLKYQVLSAEDPSEYAVAVNVEATDETVDIHFSYWRNIISEAQIRNISGTFVQIVNDLISNAPDDYTVGEIDLLGQPGIDQILRWNDFSPPHVERCIHDLISENADTLPATTPAVHGWDGAFTYRELSKITDAVAQQLIAFGGIGPDDFVPLCFEKSAWAVVAQVAVLKAGAAFVSLDPAHPDSRLRELVQDIGAKFVICSANNSARMERITDRLFVVGPDSPSSLATTQPHIRTNVTPSHAAYVIFTSGTTGKPKGTVIEHGAFCTGALAHAEAMFMRRGSRVLQFASYTFDASIMETLSCLLVGGCVCVPSDEDKMNDLGAVIRNMGVTWTLLTPSVASTIKPESVPGLQTLVTGGEAMSTGHISRWGTQCALVNAYGPTECSVVATTSTKVDESHRLHNTDPSTIGTAVGGRIWVVDAQNPDRLAPVGAVGELVVEGRHVARGYLHRPEQTAKSFPQTLAWTSHPAFGSGIFARGDKMYRTGDLVRYNSDGSISYIHRKDTQVKVNGRRIELGEIEFHCQAILPEDAQSAVEIVQHNNSKMLAVYLCIGSPTPVNDASALLPMTDAFSELAHTMDDHVSRHLPAYMVPQIFVPMATMPWTTAGKLDRRRLRQIVEAADRETIFSYRLSKLKAPGKRKAPANEAESTMQKLWESTLGLPAGSVGVNDNFFRLGGDSLTAMKLVGQARAHRVNLSVLDVFENPVLADMSGTFGGSETTTLESNPQPFELLSEPQSEIQVLVRDIAQQCQLSTDQVTDIYPCSPLQEALFALANKQTGAYVAVNTLRLPKDLDLERFKQAWQTVSDDTDTLRTRVLHIPTSGFLQVVVAPHRINWYEESSLDDAICNGGSIGSQNGGALTRYSIVPGEDGTPSYFVWSIHHALYDGWSLPKIASRVQHLYESGSRSIQIRSNIASYSSFIRYLKLRAASESEVFWKKNLEGSLTVTHFPELPVSINDQSPTFRTETCEVKIDRQSFRADVTIPTIVRAAWAMLISAYTGTVDVVFGETLSGRNIDVPGIEDISGPTFATVPMRFQVRRSFNLGMFLASIQKQVNHMAPHQHMGLQHIKRLDDDCAAACAFQSLLTIQSLTSDPGQQNQWNFEGGSSGESFFTNPLVLECIIVGGTVQATIHHDQRIMSSWHAQRLTAQFKSTLESLFLKAADKQSTLVSISTTSAEDYALIKEWNAAYDTVGSVVNSTIHGLFLEQAALHPQRLAVNAWDAQLTYAETQAHATQLALHLQTAGLPAGSMVPVCIERSAWTIVVLMAILMTGSAFVPFDPAHPLTRQKEILESLSAEFIICSPEYKARFADTVKICVTVDEGWFHTQPSYQDPPRFFGSPDDKAYILYTSGSTGRPKGVVATHRAFCSSSRGYALATNMTEASRVLHFASLTFDVALMEVLTPLTLGACVCVPTEESRLHNLGGAISQLGASWAFLTPSVANLLDPADVRSVLKTLVCGGEAMVDETVARWADEVELMNGYGPTEACVLAIINPSVSQERDRSIIGRAHTAGQAWILGLNGPGCDMLAPVGAVGELTISGPLLAQGYLNDPVKTAEVFVEEALLPGAGSSQPGPLMRFYRTGDLVRYRHDGALEFIGRRDGQVKVNGQRIELGEVESRLSADNHVQLAVVAQPKSGPCEKQLVAVITLAIDSETNDSAPMSLVPGSSSACQPADGSPEWLAKARAEVASMKSKLAETLPSFMVPSVWIVLESMPVVVSGKLDRQRVTKWLAGMDHETFETVTQRFTSSETTDVESELTKPVKMLREVWAEELRVPLDRVTTDRTFMSLGGDSIRAMGIVSRARRAGLSVTVRDVLGSKSIVHLARVAKQLAPQTTPIPSAEVEEEALFSLSPIQELYFRLSEEYSGSSRFNQSVTFTVPGHIAGSKIRDAINSIVTRHSMLRARFSKGDNGSWLQRIIKNNETAYGFSTHEPTSLDEAAKVVACAQRSLSIEHGPVFRVDVMNILGDDRSTISMIAHHLCIDMVSWRIILSDLSDLLQNRELEAQAPISFKSWCALQAKSLDANVRQPLEETSADINYWDLHGPSVYGNAETETFTLDSTMTSLALADSHQAFGSKPTDLFVAALAHSFSRIFRDRGVPTVYNESHGRDTLQQSTVDLSRTVGWFTSISPLAIRVADDNLPDTVRRAKDVRRSIQDNGRSHFAAKFSGPSSQPVPPMEVLFNYLGEGVTTKESAEDLIHSIDLGNDESVGDVGPETNRMALFEISASVVGDCLQFNFIHDRTLARTNQVRCWIRSYRDTLIEMIQCLVQRSPEPTLTDFSLLPLTYDNLRTLIKKTFPSARVTPGDVEDIYPCTPVQEGMLIGQLRDPEAYRYHAIYRVNTRGGSLNPDSNPNPNRLARAWQKIVDRHAALRTIFIESVHRGGMFDQLVLKKAESGVVVVHCRDDQVSATLAQASLTEPRCNGPQLPHHLVICNTPSGQITVKLEFNHAAVDGGSLGIILDELASQYAGQLDADEGPLYSNYIRYIRSLPAHEDKNYWVQYLKGVRPCHFPRLNTTDANPPATRQLCSMRLRFDNFRGLRRVSERIQVTLANMMHAAWALVLSEYTGSDDVCFGYLVADRDVPVDNIHRTVGTLINMLCCRVEITGSQSRDEILRQIQEQHLQSMQFQRCSLALVQHELGLGGKPLYNTSISTQSSQEVESVGKEGISFELQQGHDPSEYAITLNIDTAPGDEGVVFRYWSDHVTEDHMQTISSMMAGILDGFIQETHCPATETHAKPEIPATHQESSIPGILSLTTEEGSLPQRGSEANVLASIWRNLLNLPQSVTIGGQDSFFDLGGDSIIAMKLVGEARDQGLSLSVADVFRHPSFDDMAASLQTSHTPISATSSTAIHQSTLQGTVSRSTSSDSVYEKFSLVASSNVDAYLQTNIVPQVGVFRGGISDVLPATDFQALAVTGSLLSSRWMLNYFYLDGVGALDVERLRRACFSLVQGLDILRTIFVPSGGQVLQVVLRTVRPIFRVVEIDDDSMDDFTATLVADEPAPQLAEPLVKFIVIKRRSSQQHRILLRISHAQYDGVCFPRILECLQAGYRGDAIPQPPTFANYLRASAGSLTTDHYRHWKRLLDGSSMAEIVGRDRPDYHKLAAGASTSLKTTVTLPPVEHGRITTATVVKAAWAYVLAQISAADDVVFGHTISGRNGEVEGVESMMGPCLNLVPVRVRFGSQAPTVRELLAQIQDQQVANMPHEVLGFREIIRHCTDWPNWTYFTSTVQHQNIEQTQSLKLGEVDYQVGCARAAPGEFADFSVFSQPTPGGSQDSYELILSFSEHGPITTDFAQRVLNMLGDAARLFATDPDMALPSSYDLSSRHAELPLHSLLAQSNSPASTSPLPLEATQKERLRAYIVSIWLRTLDLARRDHTEPSPSQPDLGPEASFFSLGGDMTTLGQATLLLSHDGFPGSILEQLADDPTVEGHMRVLAAFPDVVQRVVGPQVERRYTEEKKKAVVGVAAVKAGKKDSPLAKAASFFRKIGGKRVEVVV